MSINNHWRNKQLNHSFLAQEKLCLDFLNKHQQLLWSWKGLRGNFFDYCKNQYQFSTQHPTGLVIVNYPTRVSPGQFVSAINKFVTDDIQAVYIAVNRYEFVAVNDLNIDYKETLSDTMDQIISLLNRPFKRHANFTNVDGRHFVGVHGLDIFTYENCQ